jgi:hypothetical protein
VAERIDAHRLRDILELDGAEIARGDVEPSLDLTIRVLGETDRAWVGDSFQSRGDIDAVAHQVAVGLLDNVAQMNADPELDAALRRQARIALGHAVLHLNCAAHGGDHAAKLDKNAVAGALDDAPVMQGDGRIEQIAAQRSESPQNAILVGSREPAVTDHVRDQNCRNLPGFGHGTSLGATEASTKPDQKRMSSLGAAIGGWPLFAHSRQPE